MPGVPLGPKGDGIRGAEVTFRRCAGRERMGEDENEGGMEEEEGPFGAC